ncbi:PepSY domain-containing protein [Streptomyces sp. NEAU-S77]|uniref:PepSY domain-containing protein n=1 Tax=Streptomyces sp. NEAU-S77 TaxID=3411033 RepID=UPI003BA39166
MPQQDDATAAPDSEGGRRGWSVLRPLVLRLHFYAGALVAPFLLVAAVTGLRYAGSLQAVEIVPPTGHGAGYTVSQIQRSWPEKQDAAAVDAATGQVTDVVRFTDYPLLAKLSRGGVDAHMGSLFGLPNQIALAALALALIFLILWGYRMWWQRGRAGAFGRPIPRGAWRQVPSYALATLTVAIAVLGYYLPLLGIPLAAFLLIDLALGRLADRSGKRTQTAGT